MPFLGKRPGVVIGTTFLRWIFDHSKHFECFSYELTTEELSVLFNLTLLFPVEISFRTVFEQYFSGLEPILVADRVPPKLIEVIQSLISHIIKEFSGRNFVEETANVQFCS